MPLSKKNTKTKLKTHIFIFFSSKRMISPTVVTMSALWITYTTQTSTDSTARSPLTEKSSSTLTNTKVSLINAVLFHTQQPDQLTATTELKCLPKLVMTSSKCSSLRRIKVETSNKSTPISERAPNLQI